MKANTTAAADVLQRPDNTIQLVLENSVLSVLSLPLSRSFPLVCVYLVMTHPVFHPGSMSTVQSGPAIESIMEAFCLRLRHGRAVVQCGAHGPGQIELNALPGSKEAQLL